jgi:Zn-finger nucleic acid-binding protein
MMFKGNKHCPRCGTAAARVSAENLPARRCPCCRIEMQAIVIGATAVRECSQCLGLWVDVGSFEKICADREQQAAVLGGAGPAPAHSASETTRKISYVPCPECAKLMNRINFAKCSGVIVDICKGHGIWFDLDELSRIVEFVRGGGLDAARSKEIAQLEEARRQLEVQQLAADSRRSSVLGFDRDDHRISGIASARDLLKILLD